MAKATKVTTTGIVLKLKRYNPSLIIIFSYKPLLKFQENTKLVVKIIIVALLIFIVFNLFRALFIMVKNDPNGPKMSTFLGRRVGFSALVLLLIIVAVAFGLIEPNARPR
jgi:exosortase/archaeosortase family protein